MVWWILLIRSSPDPDWSHLILLPLVPLSLLLSQLLAVVIIIINIAIAIIIVVIVTFAIILTPPHLLTPVLIGSSTLSEMSLQFFR